MDSNKKQSVKLVIAGILVVIMFISIANAVVQIKKKKRKKRPQPKVAEGAAAPTKKESIKIGAEKETKQPLWGQDPFTGRAIRSGFGRGAGLQLSGIIYNTLDSRESYAIIDNSVVRVGDTVKDSNMKVKEIKEQEVILSDGSKEVKLKLW